jgi:hypothetical protein
MRLWFEWVELDKPWVGMPVPCDQLDGDLFVAATTINLARGWFRSKFLALPLAREPNSKAPST